MFCEQSPGTLVLLTFKGPKSDHPVYTSRFMKRGNAIVRFLLVGTEVRSCKADHCQKCCTSPYSEMVPLQGDFTVLCVTGMGSIGGCRALGDPLPGGTPSVIGIC